MADANNDKPGTVPDSPKESPAEPLSVPDETGEQQEILNSSSRHTIIIDAPLVAATKPQLEIKDGRLYITLEVQQNQHINDTRETTGDPEDPHETTITLRLAGD